MFWRNGRTSGESSELGWVGAAGTGAPEVPLVEQELSPGEGGLVGSKVAGRDLLAFLYY